MSLTSERLRMLREKAGRSQGEVARLIGVSRPAYVSYETGRSKPSRKIRELANLFNVSTDFLLGLTDSPVIPLLKTDTPSEFSRAVEREHAKAGYFRDPSVAEFAEAVRQNPDLKILFDASKGLTRESLADVVKFVEFQKAKEEGL